MGSVHKRVQEFYDKNAEHEWERLDRHRTEFEVTMRAMREFMPSPPATVVDIGGGPGRYSIALERLGYSVTLLDLSQACIEFARRKSKELGIKLSGLLQGNALDLRRLSDRAFDVVLLMGPLYHLVSDVERRKAIIEAKRVLRSDGLIFAAVITRYAPIRWSAKNEPAWFDVQGRQILETGVWQGPETSPATTRVGFTESYFALPSELVPLMESCGFETLSLIGCEGAISLIEDKVNELTGTSFDQWVGLNYKLGKDPIFLGAAEHLLYVGRKENHEH